MTKPVVCHNGRCRYADEQIYEDEPSDIVEKIRRDLYKDFK